MRKTLVVALAAVLSLSLVATALAQRGDPKNTTNKLSVKVSPSKSGTSKKPKPVDFTLGITGGTKNGQGQPASSTSLNTVFPSGLKINTKSWPKDARCDIKKMRALKSDSTCKTDAKGSFVGKGTSIAKAGTLTETIKVTAYVIKNGNIGFYLDGKPVKLGKTLEGKVVKSGQGLNVTIDPDVYQPVTGLFTGITKLEVVFTGRAKVKGKTIGSVQSTKCPSSKKWNFTFQNVLLGGGKIDNKTSIPCKS